MAGESPEVVEGDVAAGDVVERPPAENKALIQFEAW